MESRWHGGKIALSSLFLHEAQEVEAQIEGYVVGVLAVAGEGADPATGGIVRAVLGSGAKSRGGLSLPAGTEVLTTVGRVPVCSGSFWAVLADAVGSGGFLQDCGGGWRARCWGGGVQLNLEVGLAKE